MMICIADVVGQHFRGHLAQLFIAGNLEDTAE